MIDGMRPKDRETRGRDRRISDAVAAKRAVVRAHAGGGPERRSLSGDGTSASRGGDALAVGEAAKTPRSGVGRAEVTTSRLPSNGSRDRRAAAQSRCLPP